MTPLPELSRNCGPVNETYWIIKAGHQYSNGRRFFGQKFYYLVHSFGQWKEVTVYLFDNPQDREYKRRHFAYWNTGWEVAIGQVTWKKQP